MGIKSYRDLVVWQRSMDLAAECYRIAALLPKTEQYGLASQMRRSAVSVPANVAEGHGRSHTGQYLHHLSIARGSLMELETHLLLAGRLGLVKQSEAAGALELSAETSRMLSGLSEKLRRRVHAS
ncbi:MAG: four helix bundle protein [Acidobacteriota bacterium]